MRLPLSSSPPPHPAVPHERSSLLAGASWRPVRPGLWRKASAPAALQHAPSDFFDFPRYEGARSQVAQHLEAAEEAAEAGCFRLAIRALTWWAWHRWH
jgi:hypothetical protein